MLQDAQQGQQWSGVEVSWQELLPVRGWREHRPASVARQHKHAGVVQRQSERRVGHQAPGSAHLSAPGSADFMSALEPGRMVLADIC